MGTRDGGTLKEATWHQLLVIGNGFDLECGLHSRFADFFRPRSHLIKTIVAYGQKPWCDKVQELDLTVWDFIFWSSRESDWRDIESIIESWVVGPVGDGGISYWVRRTVRAVQKNPFVERPYFILKGNRLEDEIDDDAFVIGNVSRFVFMRLGRVRARQARAQDVIDILRDEVRRLESLFAAYLVRETMVNTGYKTRAEALFEQLRCDCVEDALKGELRTGILSFNYTTPFEDLVAEGAVEVLNIHGTLVAPIIFGIDGKDLIDNALALPFTKTYRVAVSDIPIKRGLFSVARSMRPSHTKIIKFYGHSLGEADYSYFQSVFDAVDLYGADTQLIFYYRCWWERGVCIDEVEARTQVVKRVAHLLDTYGSTMDNKDHGKNLMHRLLLEGRLLIRRI